MIKVSVTGAGHLRECKNTEFVWELTKTGCCEGSHKYSCSFTRMYVGRASTAYGMSSKITENK